MSRNNNNDTALTHGSLDLSGNLYNYGLFDLNNYRSFNKIGKFNFEKVIESLVKKGGK